MVAFFEELAIDDYIGMKVVIHLLNFLGHEIWLTGSGL